MITPDVVISVHRRFPPHTYVCHLRQPDAPADCYVIDFDAWFVLPYGGLKRYRFHVYGILGRTSALRACEAYFRRLAGFEASLVKEFRYVQ